MSNRERSSQGHADLLGGPENEARLEDLQKGLGSLAMPTHLAPQQTQTRGSKARRAQPRWGWRREGRVGSRNGHRARLPKGGSTGGRPLISRVRTSVGSADSGACPWPSILEN